MIFFIHMLFMVLSSMVLFTIAVMIMVCMSKLSVTSSKKEQNHN